jgi:hypothetical protein
MNILVGRVQVAVPQAVEDHELVFAHLGQHGPHSVPESVLAHAGDADSLEGRSDLLLQHQGQVERFAPFRTVERHLPREFLSLRVLPLHDRGSVSV